MGRSPSLGKTDSVLGRDLLRAQKDEHRQNLTQEYQSEISDLWEHYAVRNERKQCMVGVVTSTKCAKSITVMVTRQKLIPKYRKFINTRKKFMAHDEEEKANLGDLVRIVPCRPMSRKKRHKLMDIVKECGQLNFGNDESTGADPAEVASDSDASRSIESQRL